MNRRGQRGQNRLNNPVDTIRQIVSLLTKWILIAVFGLAGIAFLIGAAVWAYNWYTFERHVQNIAVIISTDKKDCPDDAFPIYVMFGNKSSKTLESVSFTLRARVKGRSTNLALHDSYTDDHISEPNMGYANCWPVPKLSEPVTDPRSLEWDIIYKRFSFRD